MQKETERKYLDDNSKYYIEQNILSSLSIKEIQNFISPLYKEYKALDTFIENKTKENLSRYSDLDKISEYFIELLVKQDNGGNRLDELENTLQTFNTHLYSKLPSKRKYTKEFKKIDINEIPIKNVIGKYIKLPSNLRRNLKCPLHKDNTASFKIYENTNSFYCFGCGRGGNSINFISYMENITTKEGYKRFIEMYNL
ncbi:MAG: CHC2 zinc finger domain-containing protein [Candidatus Gracilibacteria bacterium]